MLLCSAFPGPPVGRRADSSCFSYSERNHGIEQFRIVRSDPHGRRRGRAGPQRVADVASDAFGRLGAAAVALEALEGDAEALAVGPQVRGLEAALVGVERLRQLPEPPLRGGGLDGVREGDGTRVL